MSKEKYVGELTEREYTGIALAKRQVESEIRRFPEVRGVCRTCSSAHIWRRELSEVPAMVCRAMEPARRMPLDIMECSLYSRKGEMRLDELGELALIVDPRENGGQYL